MGRPRTNETEAIDWCNRFEANRLLRPDPRLHMLTDEDRQVVARLKEEVEAGDEQVIGTLALLEGQIRELHYTGFQDAGQRLDYQRLEAYGARLQVTALRIGQLLSETVAEPAFHPPVL